MADLNWPAGFDRTPADERGSYPGNITVGHRQAFESITEELHRWGATSVDVSFDAPSYANDPGIPHKSASPDDPAIVARFRREGESADDGYAIACDRYETLLENARAIALYARRKRLAERCGVTTAESEFATARLPPGDEDGEPVVVEPTKEPHEVLNVAADAAKGVVKAAARAKKKEHHPDSGGSTEAFQRVVEAEEAMLE